MQQPSLSLMTQAVSNARLIGSWVTQAACRGTSRGFTSYPTSEPELLRVVQTFEGCPVWDQCEAYSGLYEVDGVWAGKWHNAGRKPLPLRSQFNLPR